MQRSHVPCHDSVHINMLVSSQASVVLVDDEEQRTVKSNAPCTTTAVDVPNAQSRVEGCRSHIVAVGVKRHCVDVSNMSREHSNVLSSFDRPKPC
jgi:hypothetical protein